jgi:hypothetical protein
MTAWIAAHAKSIMVALAALDAYLLTQPDVVIPPIGKVVLGGLAVALAAIDPNRNHA